MDELFKQIAPRLFYVEYDDFDFDKTAEWMNARFLPEGPFCSGVRKGRYTGRNLDILSEFKYAFVMRVNKSCARYSSIGVNESSLLPEIRDSVTRKEKDNAYCLLPQMTYDGINECGLTAMSFMSSTSCASEDRSKWGGREWGKSAAFTNPAAEKTLSTSMLVRYVLDNAADVDEAVRLISQVNWFDPDRFTWRRHAGAFKWMISDPGKTVVIECIDNEIRYSFADDINAPSYRTLAHNFSQYLMEKGIIQYDSTGYERYDQMAELYDPEDESLDCVKRILMSVMMSGKCRRDISDRFFFATEYMWDESPSGKHFNAEEIYRGGARQDPDFISIVELEKSRHFDKALRPEDYQSHDTVYTTIYDMEGKSVQVLLSEGVPDGLWYEFRL